ncbi:hypothetical protein YC2023_033005 [Brassica napus]
MGFVVYIVNKCYTKLVSGQSLIDHPILDEVKIARTRHVMGHLQSQDYVFPVIKITPSPYCA